jgi:hypothetical protein
VWIFDSPENYTEMIQKISKSTFFVLIIMLYVLSQINNEFSEFLKSISFGGIYEFAGIKINLATLYLPLVMGVFEHMFKIHDKLSDLLGIRRKYDRNIIVAEFLKTAKNTISIKSVTGKQVRSIMSSAFYRYASSTNPIIDRHYILLALNEWCWFWIVLDTTLLLVCVSIPFLVSSFNASSVVFILITLGTLSLLMLLILLQVKSYTLHEIEAILSDDDRKKIIIGDVESALHH